VTKIYWVTVSRKDGGGPPAGWQLLTLCKLCASTCGMSPFLASHQLAHAPLQLGLPLCKNLESVDSCDYLYILYDYIGDKNLLGARQPEGWRRTTR
jgi:hypothetical protein